MQLKREFPFLSVNEKLSFFKSNASSVGGVNQGKNVAHKKVIFFLENCRNTKTLVYR
jgi:hypothetical protein